MVLRKHYVATGYVYNSNTDTFLLIFHKKLGRWLPPGGHLHEGEELHLGALRELLEETGMEGKIIDLLETPDVSTRNVEQIPAPFCILSETIPSTSEEDEEHIHIDFVYAVEIDLSKPLNLCKEEISLAGWFSLEHINRLETYENVRQVCRSISTMSRREKTGQ